MAEKYPALAEMGITNPEDITRYSMQYINNIDVLRIVYKRKKGSLLPTSKKFRFGRSKKMVVTDSGLNKTEVLYEVSPFVSKVTDELHKIVELKHSQSKQKEIILDEIHRLEEETNTRITYLKELVSKLE
ncbi:MAG: DUF3461 family protein [Cocleimonas sp.]